MKLLFNDTTDLKQLLGFLDADLTFDNFKTDLEHASLDLKKLIGKDVYAKIEAYFLNTSGYVAVEGKPSADDMADLLKKAQLPIALFANIAIESNTDLNHTNSGRIAKIGSGERQAWEWQIEKDTAAQRRRAYKALDILIETLDNLELLEWFNSPEYSASKACFIHSSELFEKVYPINKSRQLYLRLVPFMEDAEEEYIEPIIGAARFDALKEKVLDDDLLPADKKLYNRINKVIGFFVLADSFKTLPIEMFPEGTVEYREKGRMASQARAETMEFFNKKARYHLDKLTKQISKLDNPTPAPAETITGLNAGDKFVSL